MSSGDWAHSDVLPARQSAAEVLNRISDPLIALDRQGRITALNGAAEGVLNQNAEALLGQTVWESLPETPDLEQTLRRALEQNDAVRLEWSGGVPPREFEIRAYPDGGGLTVLFQEISERKEVERTLRDSEERFRATFEQAAIGVAHVGLAGRWLWVNARLCDILGYDRNDLLSRTFQDVTLPEDLETVLNEMRRLLTGESSTYTTENRSRREDGSTVWNSLTVSLVRDEVGQPRYFLAFVEDISLRKRTEAALRRSEQRYRSLVNATSSIVWTTDGEGSIVTPNPSWQEYTGQTPEQYFGWGWLDAIHPADRERTGRVWRNSLALRTLYEVEYRLIRQDGSYRHVVARGAPLLDSDGTIREWIGTCSDVTDARRAERELRWNESLLREMAHAAPLGLLVVDDRTDAVLFYNRRFCEIWGIVHLEPRLQRSELTHADIISECLERVADRSAFVTTSGPLPDESRGAERVDEIPFNDGRTIRRFSSPIRDDSGRYHGRLYLFEDITEQQRAALSLHAAKEEAERTAGPRTSSSPCSRTSFARR